MKLFEINTSEFTLELHDDSIIKNFGFLKKDDILLFTNIDSVYFNESDSTKTVIKIKLNEEVEGEFEIIITPKLVKQSHLLREQARCIYLYIKNKIS